MQGMLGDAMPGVPRALLDLFGRRAGCHAFLANWLKQRT
jgi:hypothetical protein